MLRSPALRGFDWHLDPTERAAVILPMLEWMPADLAVVNTRPTWIVSGMLATGAFPLAARALWRGRMVAGAGPVLLCTVDAASGEAHFYVDPAADSLGVAWARFIGPLVAPASALPMGVRRAVTYDGEWFRSQTAVLTSQAWNAGSVPTQFGIPVAPAPVWMAGNGPGRQVALKDAAHGEVASLLTAFRTNGIPQLRLNRREHDGTAVGSRRELRQAWDHMPILSHLTDSLVAAGDSVSWRAIRWYPGRRATAAWRPLFALPSHGAPVLIWIAAALGDRVGGGPAAAQAWTAALQPHDSGGSQGPDAATSLESARQWLQRADSAFRRGDMTAFGRAYEELRRVLARPP